MYKKPLIIFEGIDGSGKTTQITNVIKHFKKKNKKFIKLREPGGSKNSEIIRNIILKKSNKFDKYTDLLLYIAARNENIKNIISKNYKKKIILIDRYIYSTIAYQCYGMGINKNFVRLINDYIVKKYKPTHIFLHLVDEKNLKKRLKNRLINNRYDYFKLKFYSKVQKGFLKLLKNKKNVTIVDSNKSIKENKTIIIKKINKLI
tara:strand:- start:1314 stop:1925 length:612 start_codon:yes stop_codon:yes gene_type:complete